MLVLINCVQKSTATLLRFRYSITSISLMQVNLQWTTAQVSSVPQTPYLGFMSRIPVKYSVGWRTKQVEMNM